MNDTLAYSIYWLFAKVLPDPFNKTLKRRQLTHRFLVSRSESLISLPETCGTCKLLTENASLKRMGNLARQLNRNINEISFYIHLSKKVCHFWYMYIICLLCLRDRTSTATHLTFKTILHEEKKIFNESHENVTLEMSF